MAGHVLDQLVFAERRKFKESTKNAVFVVCAVAIAGTFWWFRAISFGIEGPVGDHHGWQWRRVSVVWRPMLVFISPSYTKLAELERLLGITRLLCSRAGGPITNLPV